MASLKFCPQSLEIVKYFFNKGADIDKYDGTILHLAVCNEKPDIVEYLISKGVDVNAKYHKMPLHLAASRGLGRAIFFIQKGSNINTKSKNGNTSLHLAAIVGRVDIAKILLKHNADVNTKNNEEKTALHYAAKYNHQELVELLLAHGASIL
ncbi:ankyrin repeat domain-containing protein [Wolbachia endosymbiont (group A) of Trypoxylon clavicerum]|uniref:ankyrin repeat domain-containing protein n=1 Tax=Wolbachia endosymbiont (group A) of Trypoxylon clavicerum TaxID=2954064 RepID=UPI00222F3CF8|nr:ankyrin repeat domain-containing protein [Wolbachia endosymbiont (group A) of Trypoxylon clavicerum]